MRNVYWLVPVTLFVTAVQGHAFSTGVASTSFDSTGCNFCHFGGLAPTVTLTGPTNVTAGTTNEYTLQVSAVGVQNEAGLNVAGTDGTLSVGGSASASTRTITGAGGLTEITHSGAKLASGGIVTFSFLWTAPATDESVTLTAWGNAVDGNFKRSGDMAAESTLMVTVSGSVPTPTPTPTMPPACAATPLPTCHKPFVSGKSTLVVKDNAVDTKDFLSWTWTKGTDTQLMEFGDPVNGTTSYHLCVYDESASVPTVAMAMTAPPGGMCAGKPCWSATKTGFLYKDKSLTNDGLLLLKLIAGGDGKAKIVAKGKGMNLPVPAPVTPGLFAQDTTVTAQLVNSDGVCWEAEFSAPARKNQIDLFRDQSD